MDCAAINEIAASARSIGNRSWAMAAIRPQPAKSPPKGLLTDHLFHVPLVAIPGGQRHHASPAHGAVFVERLRSDPIIRYALLWPPPHQMDYWTDFDACRIC